MRADDARLKAAGAGEKHYQSSTVCKAGHLALRYVSSNGCVPCMEARASAKREEKREYDRRYRADNKDHLEKIKSTWRAANADKVRAIKKRYKHSRRAAESDGDHFSVLWKWERTAAKVCVYCGSDCQSSYHIDHYLPLALGGKHQVENLRIACPPCNFRKNALHPDEFLRRLPEILRERDAAP